MPTKDPDKIRAKNALWRAKNPDYYKNWAARNPDKIKEYERRKDPIKIRARRIVNKSINDGKIVRPDICQWCGEDYFYTDQAIEAHHEDHSKPMDIIWLCKECHAKCY